MKTKSLITILLSFSFYLLSSQVPQGFNYQALALDESGNPLASATLSVRIGVTRDAAGTDYVWEERHDNIMTNPSGMFTLVFGNPLAVKTAGSTPAFSAIDWSAIPLYLRTWIYYNSTWHNMGGAQLWSVPYAMIAGSTPLDRYFTFHGDTIVLGNSMSIGSENAGNALLAITGQDDSSDDPLFEVKRKDGQTVFAVYSEGVRVYVGGGTTKAVKGGFAIGSFDESKGLQDLMVVRPDCVRVYLDNNPAKAVKGGFAIGSFDESKALVQDYLKVSPDSVRIYIDDTGGKAVKGGFAIGGFDVSKSPGSSFFDIQPATTAVIDPSEPRILWYPLKNAFLAGQVLIPDPVRVGTNSMSIGYETSAEGAYSQALGYKSRATGINSTAIGMDALADGANSFAFGDSAIVQADDAYAIGAGALATGRGSFAIGSKDRLFGDNYVLSTSATGDLSMAMGLNAKAIGSESFASGIGVSASGDYSVALGRSSSAEGLSSMAIGGVASNLNALAIRGTASGLGSLAIASGTASAWLSTAISGGEASGEYSIAVGNGVKATGNNATAIGVNNTAQAYGSFVAGYYNIVEGTKTTVVASDPLFVVGNGTYLIPSNALTVLKNGRVAIGHNAPTQMLDVNGQLRIRGGNPDAGKVLTSAADGTATWENIVIGSHTHSATDITDGILPVARGGTGLGSHTANKLLMGNGGGALYAVNDLHWDGTNFRLGIGTSVPGYGIDVNGTGRIQQSAWLATGSGNVGIGATTASTKLRVNGNLSVGTYNAAPVNGLAVSGSVGIGTSSPADNLHLANTAGAVKIRMEASSGNSSIEFRTGSTYLGAVGANHTENYLFIYQGDNISFKSGRVGIGNTNPGEKLDITAGNGRVASGYQWLTSSDIRYKKNVTTLEGSLNKVLNLRGVRYDVVESTDVTEGSGKHIGFIAQELEQLFPEFVVTGEDGYKSVAYDKMSAVLVEAVKEQQSQIESYRNEINSLRNDLEAMRAEMEAFRTLLMLQGK